MRILLSFLILVGMANCSRKDSATSKSVKEVNMEKTIGIDVRTLSELKVNPAAGAVHIEMENFESQFEAKFPDKNTDLSIFCEAGGRAERVKEFLASKGYANVKNIGSWREWNALKAQ